MNKLIKLHWDQFNDIKGSKKSKTQFFPCQQHPSHIIRCINATSRFILTLPAQAIRIVIWLLFDIIFQAWNEKEINEMLGHCSRFAKLHFHLPFQQSSYKCYSSKFLFFFIRTHHWPSPFWKMHSLHLS
jgi:hypothetical protein